MSDMIESHLDGPLSDLDLHLFEHEDKFLAFDARTFSIFQVDAAGALVTSMMSSFGLAEIKQQLHGQVHPDTVEQYYRRVVELAEAGTLSTAPVDRPPVPNLTNLVLMLAGGCNMGCSYCFEQDVPVYQKPNLLSIEAADVTLDWFFGQHSGTYAHVELYGGEPLLNWDIVEYVISRLDQWASRNKIILSKYMITNGTLLTEPRAHFLRSHKVEVQVSVDGDKETHNRNRTMKTGTGTYDRVVQGVSHLKSAGTSYNLRAVMTRKNLSTKSILASLRSLGAERISFGVVSSAREDNRLSEKDWVQFLDGYKIFLRETASESGEIPSPLQSTVRNIVRQHRIHYGCGAGLSEVTVAPDGDIFECQRLMGKPLGSIYDNKSVKQLNSSFLTQVDDRRECSGCPARYLCGGGCKETFVTQTGSDTAFSEWCSMKMLELEESVALISDLSSKGALRHSVTQISRGSSSCA